VHLGYVHRDRRRRRNELTAAITAYIRHISQADLQKVFADKIGRVQNCIDARGHHFPTSIPFYKYTTTFRTHCTGLFISASGISELDCATTKKETAERSISIGRESLHVFFCTRDLGVLPGSTVRG
jgi:hypothetical protein